MLLTGKRDGAHCLNMIESIGVHFPGPEEVPDESASAPIDECQ
jgi:hypothetical protein